MSPNCAGGAEAAVVGWWDRELRFRFALAGEVHAPLFSGLWRAAENRPWDVQYQSPFPVLQRKV